MEINDLLANIEKAHAHALKEAKENSAAAKRAGEETEALALHIAAHADLAVVRALDTILGWNTPAPLLEQPSRGDGLKPSG